MNTNTGINMSPRRLILLLLCSLTLLAARAQLYTGLSGLLQTPSAEMYNAGDARIGGYYLNNRFLPREGFVIEGKPYNSCSFYASITPFSWVEIGYTFTLLKGNKGHDWNGKIGYYHKDQYFSLKVRPLKEGRWWPAIALGTNDPFTTDKAEGGGEVNQYFGNYYIAATKHFDIRKQTIGVTLAYRRYARTLNRDRNGLVGGLTYRPSFFRSARAVIEWTGDAVNFGIDCLLFRHLIIQASLYDGRHFSGGLCYCVNLF